MSTKTILLFAFVFASAAFQYYSFEPRQIKGWSPYFENGSTRFEEKTLPNGLKEVYQKYISKVCSNETVQTDFCKKQLSENQIESVFGNIYVAKTGYFSSHCMYKVQPKIKDPEFSRTFENMYLTLNFHYEIIFKGQPCKSFKEIVEKYYPENFKSFEKFEDFQSLEKDLSDKSSEEGVSLKNRIPIFMIQLSIILDKIRNNEKNNPILIIASFLTLFIPHSFSVILNMSYFFAHAFKKNHMFFTIFIIFYLLCFNEARVSVVMLFFPLFFNNKRISRDFSVIFWFWNLYGATIRHTEFYNQHTFLCFIWFIVYAIDNFKKIRG